MAVETKIEIYGIKDALKELNKTAPSLRREITKEYKTIVASVIKDAQAAVPEIAPISGFEGPWRVQSGWDMLDNSGWVGVKASRLITAKISTRRVKEFQGTMENVGTFRVVWTGLANTVYEIAGRKNGRAPRERSRLGQHGKRVGTVGGQTLIAVLRGRYGSASRTLWPSWEKNKTQVEIEMQNLCDKVMKAVNRNVIQAPQSKS